MWPFLIIITLFLSFCCYGAYLLMLGVKKDTALYDQTYLWHEFNISLEEMNLKKNKEK
ncbi:hypothetical protein [Chengkuizengella axinellae]|uniref:Uncharacterized protein n=1 Tax=Chengkuizengella axinellae TaxID=3064388 RepID=A0ABT9IT91_9BACL|nr:hypothetical protein [Chengkuizengella sp. 2205SS18-9]MDP5272575.1 hypothetical protein [Chengkuizengella sp. 2205SS18-9]